MIRELKIYKLIFVAVQEVRWEGEDAIAVENFTFFCGKENDNHLLGKDFLFIAELEQNLREYSLLVTGCLM